MSLFKARDWWSTVVGENEEFDTGCLCVGNIDNSTSGLDKVIVGSFHGFLRIYNPRPQKLEDGTWSGFRPEEVMCETHLQLPIIQVEVGKFASGSDNLHLAVLHPRKISVYSVTGSAGAVEHGSQYQLKLIYEHVLKRTAVNFCYGPFGGVKGRDFLCVQSMDGTVSVFEQETFAFTRFLPGALLPGPIQYVPRTDSFVTVSSARQVESYKYQVLAVATDAKTKEESQNLKSGKRVAVDWTFNTGEQALDMKVVTFSGTPSILVLGERNLFCLSEGGKLRYMNKFDYNPSCFLPYASLIEGNTNILIGTHTSTLLVYQNITLKWASQLDSIPVQIRIANLTDLRGVIVTLDEDGHLRCNYLGTDPSMFRPPTCEVRDLDFSEMDNEMAQLQRVIREQQGKSMVLPAARSDDDIQVMMQIPHQLDDRSEAEQTEVQDTDPIPSITAKVVVKARMALSDVMVRIHVHSPLFVSEPLVIFPSVDPSRPAETRVSFYMKNPYLPCNLSVVASATYTNTSGAPRVVTTQGRLPLQLVVKACLPVKNANYKLTIDTNKPPVNLNDIFPELLGDNAGGPGNALGFQVYGGAVVTILASKTSQRYRLQCDEFEAMWPVLNDLILRLTDYHKARKISDFKITYEGALPLQEYFEVLDKHFDYRLQDSKYKALLSERAAQFRAVQRRLLTRFKDKTPAPLQNLDTLMDGTYRQILALADAAEENSREEEKAGASLSCATQMLNKLIKMWNGMSDAEFKVLESALTPVVSTGDQKDDSVNVGWEEMVDASVTHLLRTCLAKSSKDQTVNPSPLASLKDTSKLKKHIALLCDRLSKGARLIVDGMPTEASSKAKKAPVILDNSIPEETSPIELGEAEVPTGSKFGENKSPRPKKVKKQKSVTSDDGGGGRSLPPLNDLGSARGLPPLAGQLQDLSGGGGKSYLKKKPSEVPDLGELEASSENGDTMINGGNELVYGL